VTYHCRGEDVTRPCKTFLATSHFAGGVIHVVIVTFEDGSWAPYFRTDPDTAAHQERDQPGGLSDARLHVTATDSDIRKPTIPTATRTSGRRWIPPRITERRRMVAHCDST
jgi:hypothetical protein